ncbi:hypothetical protein BDN72DRAFT_834492 [Pluteus cervinus]|uniref:Uncharacterized protein n=1 Tax=Pluteus cervinus TaxID=181527 RepID=A0ACD3B680_9AGAR|nr:hypothetical protein BDN72DRAFT_834492 [Pluteus cervinus]
MGKSAKFLKRTHKKLKSGGNNQLVSTPAKSTDTDIQNAKKKASLKSKASKANTPTVTNKRSADDKILGGADYVSLMMGGRRKAKQEAEKLPRGEDDDGVGDDNDVDM